MTFVNQVARIVILGLLLSGLTACKEKKKGKGPVAQPAPAAPAPQTPAPQTSTTPPPTTPNSQTAPPPAIQRTYETRVAATPPPVVAAPPPTTPNSVAPPPPVQAPLPPARPPVPIENVGPGFPSPAAPAVPAPSDRPLLSTGMTPNGEVFTDSKEDSILAVLVSKSQHYSYKNGISPNENLILANAVNHVELAVDGGIAKLHLGLKFTDQELRLAFAGQVKAGASSALAPLQASEMQAQVVCADEKQLCRSAVIVLEQLREGRVCRRIYIVHRWMMKMSVGAGHFTMSDDDYINWKKRPNLGQKSFLRMLANTAHWNKTQFKENPEFKELPKVPRLRHLDIRSWTVAEGPAAVEISMVKMNRQDPHSDGYSMYFSAPLTKPRLQGEMVEEFQLNEERVFDAQVDKDFNEHLASTLAGAYLVGNDGRGNLSVMFQFYENPQPVDLAKASRPQPTAQTQVNFTSLKIRPVATDYLLQVIP